MSDLKWWQKGIIYQVYPRSFLDSNGDGVGDIRGIEKKINYFVELGINAIWVCPFFPSPMKDFGYDISNYCGVDPIFGTMKDFQRLVKSCHANELKVIIDLVPNHTSDQHPWFLESRKDIDSPKRDWYIWKDPQSDGSPPNNWLSVFGGPAWEYDKQTSQYYFHQYLSCQPDLNYENPEVLKAILRVMIFWLNEGVDGFRVDVIGRLKVDPLFRDEPLNAAWNGEWEYQKLLPIYTYNLPEVHQIVKEFRRVIDKYNDRVLIGELNFLGIKDVISYYGDNNDECHMPFNFQLIHHDWTASTLKITIDEYERYLPKDAWPNWVIGNHDWHRMASRIGNEKYRLAIMLLLTLRGTPIWYYGDEIGLESIDIPIDKIQDPWAKNNPKIAKKINRDPARTPMQWDASINSGFCPPSIKPWLPISSDYQERNVDNLQRDPNSVLNFTKKLIHLRNENISLYSGKYEAIDCGDIDILAFKRISENRKIFFIYLNFSILKKNIKLNEETVLKAEVSTKNINCNDHTSQNIILHPFEGKVFSTSYY